MSKADFLRELDEENQRWEALLSSIGEARMEQPGVAGHWSVKDIVAHITSWRRRTVQRLQAAARREPVPPDPWPAALKSDETDNEINAWFYERERGKSVQEVLAELRQVFQQMRAAIQEFSETDLTDPGRFPWLEGKPLTAAVLFSHFREEHEPGMRAWLEHQETS